MKPLKTFFALILALPVFGQDVELTIPIYSMEMVLKNISGDSVIDVHFDRFGNADKAVAISGNPAIFDYCLEHAKSAKTSSSLRKIRIKYRFILDPKLGKPNEATISIKKGIYTISNFSRPAKLSPVYDPIPSTKPSIPESIQQP